MLAIYILRRIYTYLFICMSTSLKHMYLAILFIEIKHQDLILLFFSLDNQVVTSIKVATSSQFQLYYWL